MKKKSFPVSYFADSCSFKKMFLGRRDLNAIQMIFVSIFLVFLMLNPVVYHSKNVPEYDLNEFLPDLTKTVEKIPLADLQKIKVENHQLVQPQEPIKEDLLIVNPSEKEQNTMKNGIMFTKKTIEIKLKDDTDLTIAYPKSINGSDFNSNQDFLTMINKEWNNQNSVYRYFSMIILVSLLVVVTVLFLVFGASFFIWLTKKNQISTIKTYKESVNVVLNAMFIPTLLATIVGFISYDITVMLMIQSLGLGLVMLLIFVKTKFNDGYALDGKLSIN